MQTIDRTLTMVQAVHDRAAVDPDRPACTFLSDGELDEVHLSYGQLDARARAIASHLRAAGLAGERALLLFPPGLDFVAALFGCMYASVVAVPLDPPSPNRLARALPKLRAVAADCQPAAALTMRASLSMVQQLQAFAPQLAALRWIGVDAVHDEDADGWREMIPDPFSLAFLQYTSGSTADPKGVMVSHANLAANERMIQAAFEHDENSVVVGWLPLYHDMGLIGNLLQPLWVGARTILMSPTAFLQRPVRWLQAISMYSAHTSGGPNFGYDLCLRKVTEEQRAQLDLSRWEIAYNGAEPLRWDTLEQFAGTFRSCGFNPKAWYPCYGLAEITLFATGVRKHDLPVAVRVLPDALEQHRVEPHPDGQPIVGCGHAWLEREVVIANPETLTVCAPGEVGEVWLAGPDVGLGYWNRAAETARGFQAYLADTGAGPFLRTGDLGFWRDDQLFITGRLKDLIIIAGRNLYPHDIELAVEEAHPLVRRGCSAAFGIDGEGPERLVVVAEVERDRPQDFDSRDVIRAIRQAVAEQFDVSLHDVSLIRTSTIPKTSSGKIQRSRCRALWARGQLELIQPLGPQPAREQEGERT